MFGFEGFDSMMNNSYLNFYLGKLGSLVSESVKILLLWTEKGN